MKFLDKANAASAPESRNPAKVNLAAKVARRDRRRSEERRVGKECLL